MTKAFNDEEYTEEALLKQMVLIENHASDGSVLDAGCHCVEGKHLLAVEGYADEGKTIMTSEKKKEFLAELGQLARQIRRNMESDRWNMDEVLRDAKLNPSAELHECVKHVSQTCKAPECNPYAVCNAKLNHK